MHRHGLDWKVLGESCKAEGQEDRSPAPGSCLGPCMVVIGEDDNEDEGGDEDKGGEG